MREKLDGCLPIVALCLGLSALAGCPGAGASPEACFAPKLAVVESRYAAEAITRCQGYTWDECPMKAEIESKYDAERNAAQKGCE